MINTCICRALLAFCIFFLNQQIYSQTRDPDVKRYTLITKEISPSKKGKKGTRILRSRTIRINEHLFKSLTLAISPAAAGGAKVIDVEPRENHLIELNLFDGVGRKITYQGLVKTLSVESPKTTIAGVLRSREGKSIPQSWFTIIARNETLAGHIIAPDGDFYILPNNRDDAYVVQQVSRSTSLKCRVKSFGKKQRRKTSILVFNNISNRPSFRNSAYRPSLQEDDGKQIDILVVYTARAEAYAGGAEKLKVRVDLAEKETNDALAISKADLKVRIVHVDKTSFAETLGNKDGTSDKDLDRIALAADGKQARDLRDAYGADQVTLLRVQGDLEGIAWLLEEPLEYDFDSARAFSAIRVDDVKYNYNFTHEFGHNLGCNHNTKGRFRYSRGYCFDLSDGKIYGTIMSYCGADNRILYYSNPNVKFGNHPTGEPELDSNGAINPKAADCARTIRESKVYVSRYRQSIP